MFGYPTALLNPFLKDGSSLELVVFRWGGLQQALAACSVTVVLHKAQLFQTPICCGSLVPPAYLSPAEGAEIFPVSLSLSLTPSP